MATAARAGAVSAPASVGKACGSGQGTLQRLEQWRLQRSVAPVAAPSGLRHCSVQQPRRSVLWLQQHLLHRPAALQERPMAPAAPVAALQERPVAPATPVAASSSLAGASCASSSTRCSPAALQERPVLPEPHLLQRPAALPESPEHLWQRPAALLERPVALAAPVAASSSLAGES